MRAVLMVIALCGLVSLAGCDKAKSGMNGGTETSEADKAKQAEKAEKERVKTNIERVLKTDASTNLDVNSATQVVSRMQAIDTTDCPNDFRAAYLAHAHAWEMMVDVEREARSVKSETESDAVLIEAFIRGFLGDPLGKANEIKAAQTQLQRSYQAANREVKQSFHRVKEVAVLHGANPHQTSPMRSIRGQWQYAETFQGKSVCGLYRFDSDGTHNEYNPTGGNVSVSTGRWAREGDSVAIRFGSGAVERATVSFRDDGSMTYTITGHTSDSNQVGRVFRMTLFDDPDQMMGVITIVNKLAGEVVFTVRWANGSNSGSHQFNDWKEFKVPPGESWDLWCKTGYHAQIKFDGSFDPGYQEKLYELPVNVVPKSDKPYASAGRRYKFEPSGTNGFDLSVSQ